MAANDLAAMRTPADGGLGRIAAAFPLHHALFAALGPRSPSHRFAGEVGTLRIAARWIPMGPVILISSLLLAAAAQGDSQGQDAASGAPPAASSPAKPRTTSPP